MRTAGISRFVITPHAVRAAEHRSIDLDVVCRIVERPQQRLTVRRGRVVLQSRMRIGVGWRWFLVRVVVDVDRVPAEVVTVYRTTKIPKYWKDRP